LKFLWQGPFRSPHKIFYIWNWISETLCCKYKL
jgi:hypothetical protein